MPFPYGGIAILMKEVANELKEVVNESKRSGGEYMDTDLLWLAKMRMKDEKEYKKFMDNLQVVVADMVKLQSGVKL